MTVPPVIAARRRSLLAAAGAATGGLLARPALAQPAAGAATTWPTRPIRIVVAFGTGGGTDITTRLLAPKLSEILGQPVVVENRPGGGGTIAADYIAKQPPNGETFLLATLSNMAIAIALYPRLPYDPQKDFANVSLVNSVANGVFVHPQVQAQSFQELVALAKREPGKLNYGTPGNGTSGHLSAEYLKSRAGIDIQHIPFRGTGGVIPELLAGRIEIAVDNLPSYLPHLREGRVRLLAVTSAERWFAVPDTPTIAESGIPGFEAVAWFGIQVPARTPRPIIERLAGLVRTAVRDPAVAARLRDVGSQPIGSTPEEFDRYVASENAKWREVVRVSGARLD